MPNRLDECLLTVSYCPKSGQLKGT